MTIMRRIFFILLIVFLIYGIKPAQSQTEEAVSNKEKPLAEESAVTAPAPVVKSVTAIEVKGNKAISTNNVLSKIKTRVGSPFSDNVISDDLKRLYLLGFFENIKIDSEDYKDGVKVIISVEERPIIEKITFTGFNRITMKNEKLKEQLKSKEKQHLDPPSLSEDVNTLKGMYEKMGFSQAKVEYKIDLDKDTNKANIQFNVLEGKKVRIKDIIVTGNKSFSSGRILKLMKTKHAWLFNAGVLKEEVLKEDIERLHSFYRRQGFTDVALDYVVKPHNKKPYLLYIYINIVEGKKYLVGNITIQGNNDITQKDILAQLKECVPGKVFSEEALKEDTANIQSLYFDKGYISCQVQDATSLNSYTGRVDIVYSIVENAIAYVDKIKIRGNIKTRDVVIRRELRINPGDRFDGEKLRRSRERLQNLGFFDEDEGVRFDTEDTQTPEKKDLIVDVKEAKTGAFSFGGGYSTVDQLIGFVEVEQKNFDWKNFPYFTGAGQDLKLRASTGTVSSGFELSFTNPWVFDYPVSFGFDLYKRTHSRDEDVGYGYDEDVTGGDLRLGKELSEYLRADVMYRLDQIKIADVTDTASSDLKSEEGNNGISSITPSFTFDSRDNVFEPRKGNLYTSSFELAGGPLGGDKDFWKYFGRASQYFPLPKNSSLELRARVGASEPYGDSERIPIYERFFAGGAYTVRGYEERKLGPIDAASEDPLGGEALMVGNIEYTYPLVKFLKLALFCDTGNVWANLNDIGQGGFKTGVGLGFRIKTPIGPIMLDYGVPLNKAPGEESKSNGRLHFSASHGF